MAINAYRPRVPEDFKPPLESLINEIGWDGIMGRLNPSPGIHPEFSPGTCQKWLIMPDVHRPFHNKVLWHKLMKLLHDNEFYGIILNGDYLDLFTLGSYNADSLNLLRDMDLDDEYKDGREGMADIEKAIRGRAMKKVYIYGNHEDRYNREIQKGDRGKYGGALLSPREALQLDKHGYEVFTNWMEDSYQLGDHLEVIHGQFTNIHTAKNHLDKFFKSVIFGHCHRIQSYGAGRHIAHCIGWLGDTANPVFRYTSKVHRMTWMNGFAIVNIDDNGYFWTQVIQCWDDKFLFNGKLY